MRVFRHSSLCAAQIQITALLRKMKLWIVISLILAICIVPTVLASSQKLVKVEKRGADDLTCERTSFALPSLLLHPLESIEC